MFPHANGELLNDEVVIIHSTGSAGESEVFDPYTGIYLLGIWLEDFRLAYLARGMDDDHFII